MNLLNYFDQSLTIEAYFPLLGEQLALHQHHYRRAHPVEFNKGDLPPLKILVITEPWCGDSTAIVPALQKFFENKKAEIRIALRDQNVELMNQFLTNGGRAIPIVIFMDEQGDYLFHIGPRPKAAQRIFEEHRSLIEQGKLDKSEVIKKIRQFYAKDRGRAIFTEVIENLKSVPQFS